MELLSLAVLGILIVISPGADFVLIFKNSLSQGRSAGVLTSIGIASGVCIHVGYSIIGIGYFISENELLFSIVKYLGAAYLIYLGLTGVFKNKIKFNKEVENNKSTLNSNYFLQGFLCNLLNPKTMLFFLSVFSQIIALGHSTTFIVSYGAYIVILHGAWFCIVSYLVTSNSLLTILERFSRQINQVCGLGLVIFGVFLFLGG